MCVALVGGMDSGKSTLIGVLTDGELDNARGKARLNLFRHLHEVQSGRTSSLSRELLGFDADGNVTNYKYADGRVYRRSAEEIGYSSIVQSEFDFFNLYSKHCILIGCLLDE
ncbi:unnamed protein product [Trichobilharzia regenti]|nr:unnamed protein product [Trichobilharzia regenti]